MILRLLFDTSILVDVDRQREATLQVLEHVTDGDHALHVSTITVAEVLTGANLREDVDAATERAHRVLGQFQWDPLDGAVAEHTGKILAYLTSVGTPIGFPDVAIAATTLVTDADRLVTRNVEHLRRVPPIEERVRTPEELASELGMG